MAKTKYREFAEKMFAEHKQLFDEFKPIHDGYAADKKQFADQFHSRGQAVIDLIRDWDRRLCAGMGRGQFSQYTQQLSEKFWLEVKKQFPLIDRVGVRSSLEK